jgi:hypothetical protein
MAIRLICYEVEVGSFETVGFIHSSRLHKIQDCLHFGLTISFVDTLPCLLDYHLAFVHKSN